MWSRVVRIAVEVLAWFAIAVGLIWLLLALSMGGEDFSDASHRPYPAELRDLAPVLATCLPGGAATLVLLDRPTAARICAASTGAMMIAAGFGFRLVPETAERVAPLYHWAPVLAGALLLAFALVGWRAAGERPAVDREPASVLLVILLWVGAFVVGLWVWLLSGDWIGAYEDQQSSWNEGGPAAVLVAVGLVAAGRHSLRL
ncbi:hypothetical protein FB381_2040 [Nocardioides albertanoniae]|uniref:Uncharacterized protein n=1 Tax=Nocardioides albertanoniae TaxID=1175486 RepID=A0A543A6C7_9ACTN|nr:hypothetical protein [Nocardioides albertanoniae]TQL68151.1 hypothetical protein FB381_2040 [Nocardioides albertanoniae]